MYKKIIIGLLLFVLVNIPKPLQGSIHEHKQSSIIFSNYMLGHVIVMNRLALQRIFVGRDTKWIDGKQIKLYIKPFNSLEHKDFVANKLKLPFYLYEQTLNMYKKQNRVVMTEVDSDDKMITAISLNAGSIGYINYTLISSQQIIVICDDDNSNC